ncbi:MAG: PAS domain S-box protein, partial [Terriglobia bacterium]
MEEVAATQNPKLRLLFVEDDPVDAELALKQLQKGGFEVTADIVETADEFRSKLASSHYDIVLSDLGLPNWSGLEALEILKQTSLDLPFIMVTGTVGEETVAECLKLGATDYVLKDRPTRLPAAIRRALREKALRDERGGAQEQILKLAAIVESSSDAIIGKTLEGVITSWNKGAEKLYGYSAAEVLGQPISILALPDRSKELGQILASIGHGAPIEQFESVRVRKDGSLVDVSLSMFPLTDSRGKVTGVASIARDITERKRAEVSVRESEERFRATFENAGIGIALVDMEGRALKSNLALRHILGYSEEEFSRMVFTEYTHPDDRELDWGLFSELAAGKWEKYEIEKRFLKKGGGVVWGLLTVSLVKGRGGRPVCAVGMVQDITERKLAEETLRKSEERFRQIAETIDEVYWISDPLITKISYISPGYERVWGRTPASLFENPRSILESIHPEDLKGVLRQVEIMMSGKALDYEFRIMRPDGAIRWIWSRGFPVHNEKGEVIHYVGVGQDITERKRAEARLQEYEKAMEGLDEMIIVVDREYRYVIANRAFLNYRGVTREQLVGQLVSVLLGKDLFEGTAKKRMDQCFQGKVVKYEMRNNFPGIGDRDLLVSYFPIEGPAGIDRIAGVLQDITERKRAEAEHLRLMTAIEQAAEAVVVTDAEGGIQYVNPAFSAMTGYSREEALGKNTRILKSGKQDAAFYASLWATILAGQVWRGEMINRRKDGSLYTEKMSITPVRNEQGEMTHIIAMMEDITAGRLMEDQFRQAQKMEAVGRLAAGVAHDFNNLLTIIIGYSDVMLERFISGDPMRAYTTQIKDAGERAVGLTRQLLAFSRQQVLAPQVLDLNAVVFNVEKMLRRLIGEDVKLRTILDPALGRVKADPGLIEQVIMNLAVNARDAMPSGGSITIETSNMELDEAYARTHATVKPGPYVMLAVGDTGVGMTPETKTHIFEPFFTTKEKGKGTGLGLATVYGIVKQSGGSVWVYSEVGQGTIFKVYLPTVSESPAAKEPAKTEPDSVSGSETILVVEDEEGVRSLIRLALESAGYKVLETEGTENALATCASYDGPIHLLLTDVVMPKMSGPLVAEKVTSLRPGIKILYMSGYTDDAV